MFKRCIAYYFNYVQRSAATTCDDCYYTFTSLPTISVRYDMYDIWPLVFWPDTRQPSREQRSSIIIVEVGPSS